MRREVRWLGALLLVAGTIGSALLILVRLGDESLLGDEAIYASVARDSARAGPWFPLVYERTPYTSKPPLVICVQRLALASGARPELAARLPSALAGLLALGVYGFWLSRRLSGTAAAAAVTLLGTGHLLLFRHGLRHGAMEGPLLLATLVAVVALEAWSRRPARGWLVVGALACACGAAAKGPVAPALLVAILAPFALALGSRRPRGMAAALAAVAAAGLAAWALWLAALAAAGVGGLGTRLEQEILQRATTGIDAEHLAGPLFYPELLVREYGAWLLLGLLALVAARRPAAEPERADSRRMLLLALTWSCVPTLLLTLPVSKLSWYLYPALPGWTLLIALGFDRLVAELDRFRLGGVLALLALAALLAPRFETRWRRATSDRPEQVTLRVLAEELAGETRRALVVDPGDPPAAAPLREWHTFYLGQIALRVDGLDAPRPAGTCAIVVTARPQVARERLALGEAPAVPVHRVTAREPQLWVVDGCGGAAARRLSALSVPPEPPVRDSSG